MKCDKCGMVAVHEKGRISLICTATSDNGHASLTAGQKATPVERMSAFINEITTKDIFIRRLNPQVEAMFKHLGLYCGMPMNMLFANLWLFGGIIKKVMPKINAQAGAMLGTSCTFFEIKGTYEEKQCTAKATLRCVSDKDLEKDLEKLKEIAKKYGVEISDGEYNEYHAPADMNSPAFKYVKNCVAEIFPDVAVASYILPAGTDGRHLSELCNCVVRFAPIQMDAQQFASVHSENENISLEAIGNAVVFYKHYIKNYK
jgi:carboxypeptidase PM20D1